MSIVHNEDIYALFCASSNNHFSSTTYTECECVSYMGQKFKNRKNIDVNPS